MYQQFKDLDGLTKVDNDRIIKALACFRESVERADRKVKDAEDMAQALLMKRSWSYWIKCSIYDHIEANRGITGYYDYIHGYEKFDLLRAGFRYDYLLLKGSRKIARRLRHLVSVSSIDHCWINGDLAEFVFEFEKGIKDV